ncbi:hypothetical protein J7U46_17665 [Pelomonas sp. V22]|uniref:2'-5' RNA ligase family protein n=1 Tax=Pelomonas sp. V22 TaxID=2822139 RepID=UPI0024A9E175|nr:hypothetical protein [Pelomonas sp. V22]MDI4634893.1 hypothetical protein [Pelomonas sp. V22]
MREQLGLPGLEVSEEAFELDPVGDPHGRLMSYDHYRAIAPPTEDARRIDSVAGQVCRQYGLAKGRQSADRLHVTLLAIESFQPDFVPRAPIGAVINAASCAAPRFGITITINRISASSRTGALVFCLDEPATRRITALRNSLAVALRKAGLKPQASKPHMTALYGCALDAKQPIESVQWTASRFVLLLSHVGLSHHQWIREWPLLGPSQSVTGGPGN